MRLVFIFTLVFLVTGGQAFSQNQTLNQTPTQAPNHAPNHAQSLTPGQAQLQASWEAFCEELKAKGQLILSQDTGNPQDTAAGYRYLAMMTAMAIDRAQFAEVPTRPVLVRIIDQYRKAGLDSPDNKYWMTKFDPDGEYVIRGRRGSGAYLGFQFNIDDGASANLNHQDMVFGEDGRFELYLTDKKRGENWLSLPEGANGLYVREIFSDWDKEKPSTMWIERLDNPPIAPVPTAQSVSKNFEKMSASLEAGLLRWKRYVSINRSRAMNAISPPIGTASQGGSPDNLYSGGYFKLAPDEAMLIELTPVEADYWAVQLGSIWFQSLDYQHAQTSLNSFQTETDPDGKIRLIVSAQDPGYANWLDTTGLAEGVIYMRWNKAKRDPSAPSAQVIKFAELSKLMPADSQRVNPAQRKKDIAARYASVARRFAQ